MEEGVKFFEGGGVHSWTLAEGTTDYAGEVHVIHCSPSLRTRPFARGGSGNMPTFALSPGSHADLTKL